MEKFTDAFLDQLREAIDITQVIKNRVKRGQVKKEGVWYAALCLSPEHEDSKPSMKWKEKDVFVTCFSCGWKADVFKIIEVVDGVTFPEAVRVAKSIVDGGSDSESREEVRRTFKEQDLAPKRTIDVAAWRRGSEKLFNYPDIVTYLAGRGLTEETMRRFMISPFADGRGITGPEHQACRWIGIPYVRDDKVVSVKYRDVSHKEYTSGAGMAGGMFNLEPLPGEFEDVYLTSGEFDAMILEQAGLRAMSMQSDSRPPDVAEREILSKAGALVYAGDNDKPGLDAMNKLGLEMKRGKILHWPADVKDANSMFEKVRFNQRVMAEQVQQLTAQATHPVPPGFTAMQDQILKLGSGNTLEDDPTRFKMPWTNIDRMFYFLPGHVIVVAADVTGTGKSTFVNQAMLYASMVGGALQRAIPAIYAAEQSPDELARMTVACLANQDKSSITEADARFAMSALSGVRFFVGYDPSKSRASEVLDLIEAAAQHLGVTDLVIDNMGFVGRNEAPGQLYAAQANAMQRVKNLAKKLFIRMWVLVGAGKAQAGERGKWGGNDAAGTAAFEADCDHFITLHRDVLPRASLNEDVRDSLSPITTVLRKKSRWPGPGGTIAKLYLDGAHAKFRQLLPGEEV